jgi:NTP pyrophosphatase (non-canonical NTP hydrolase)
MTLNEYQREAIKTAVPQAETEAYMVLGLANEAGEVAGKLKKKMRQDATTHDPASFREAMKGELGDVLWYLAGVATVMGLSLGEIAAFNLAKLKDRQERGVIRGDGDKR